MTRAVAVTAWITAWMAVIPRPAAAQNQVRRDRFDFEVLRTEHFDIHFYAEEAEMARVAGRMAERWYARLSRTLAHELRGRQPIILYAGHPHFQQTSVAAGFTSATARGITEARKRRIILPFASSLAETDHVLGHELVHAFEFDMTQDDRFRASRLPRAFDMPLWFIEGMAQYLTLGPSDPITTMWVRDAAIDDRFPDLDQLGRHSAFAFRFGHAFWTFIAGRFGDEVVGRILNAAATERNAEAGIRSVLQVSVDTLAAEWLDATRFAFGDWIERAHEVNGPPGPPASQRAGRLRVAPALSPDGRRLVSLSDRNGVSIDLIVSDVETGDDQHNLGTVATHPAFEYIQFIAGSGEWDHAGRRYAFGKGIGSDPLLVIADASGNTVLERRFTRIAEVFDPTWSPDGRRIAFTGLVGGQPDLFIYDLASDSVRQLTSDPYAELFPTWSPDGSSIAVSTDRFTTDLRTLRYGHYQLALADPVTGTLSPLPTLDDVSYLDPQWSRDGESLFFLATIGGLRNVHRLDLASHQVYRVSTVFTGIAGVTELSPALSVARDRDMMAFSVFEHGAYRIEILEGAETLVGRTISQ